MSLHEEIQMYRDFVAQFRNGSASDLDLVLEHGQEFRSVPWETWEGRYERGEPRNCFGNALDLASPGGLIYCEGFANCGNLPMIHHAWCSTEDGLVVDPTWREESHGLPVEEWKYLGIPFEFPFVAGVVFRKETTGVLDDFEIYKQPLPEFAVRKLTGSGIVAATRKETA